MVVIFNKIGEVIMNYLFIHLIFITNTESNRHKIKMFSDTFVNRQIFPT